MFYPEDSLKRGGRFYLCWVADSWPLRFATITHRQLWSQDVRRICGDLLEVITNESGFPTQRFSLRLSSQLLRGLVRLYQRKVNVLLSDMCMINSNVIKNANKKWNIQEVKTVRNVRQPLQQLEVHEIVQEPPVTDQAIEEMIQASGNAVANIQDITLREPTIIVSELLKPNDGFGEEHPDQPMQLFQDRTIEMMLNTDASATHAHSGMELALDVTDKSHDKTRLHVREAQMERLSEHDLTFGKSIIEEPMPQFDKDIPEIPDIPPPDIPVPLPEKPQQETIQEESGAVAVEHLRQPEPEEIELEDLEVVPQAKKRKLRNKLIIDKRIKITTRHFQARLEKHKIELRCQDSSDEIIDIRVPPALYFQRPCHGGMKIRTNFGCEISRLFMRNLGFARGQPREEREIEEAMQRSNRIAAISVLDRIEEEEQVPEPQLAVNPATIELPMTTEFLNISEVPRISIIEPMEVDLANMLTQKIETISQERKRTEGQDVNLKRQRSVGYMSFRESQLQKETSQIEDSDANKENRPDNLTPQTKRRRVKVGEQVLAQHVENIGEPISAPNEELVPAPTEERTVSSMLQEAGLADIQAPAVVVEVDVHMTEATGDRNKSGKGNHSDSSETPLGSLDRTKVSLGDSKQTTDSKRFIRDHWGTEGTMLKIMKLIKSDQQPVNVRSLITKGPIIQGYQRVIVARCFASILKLKQHGFIYVCKDLDTLEINNITLGPKLINSQE